MKMNRQGQAAIIAALACTTLVSGCGSKEDRRESVVECSAYLQGLASASIMGDRTLVQGVERTLETDMPDLGQRITTLRRGAAQYAESLDVARVATLETDAKDRLRKHVANNDVKGSVAYLKSCFAEFAALGR